MGPAQRALTKAPDSLDAWETYQRGVGICGRSNSRITSMRTGSWDEPLNWIPHLRQPMPTVPKSTTRAL